MVTLHNCDSLTNLSLSYDGQYSAMSLDTVDKVEGSGSVSCDLYSTGIFALTLSPVPLLQGNSILKFFIKSSSIVQPIQLSLLSYGDGVYLNSAYAIPMSSVDSWEEKEIDLLSPTSGDIPNLDNMSFIKFQGDGFQGHIIKVDGIEAEQTTSTEWSLTITAGVGGTVSPVGTIIGNSGDDTPSINATPTIDNNFSHWLLDGTEQYTDNPIILTISDNLSHTLEAVFTAIPVQQVQLTVNSTPIQGIGFTVT